MNSHFESIAVKDVIGKYMKGTFEADIPLLKSVFHENAIMNGYLGDDLVMGAPSLFINDMASSPSMASQGAAYQGEIEMIRIERSVATVIVSESGFRGDGNLVNSFHLIKTDGEWKILSKLFTTV